MNPKSTSDQMIEQSDLSRTRLILVLSSTLFLIWEPILHWLIPHAIDSFENRLLFAIVAYACTAISFISSLMRRYLSFILYGIYALAYAFVYYYTVLNDMHFAYVLGSFVILFMGTLIFSDLTALLGFIIFVHLTVLIGAYIQPEMTRIMFALSTSTISLVAFVSMRAFLKLIKELAEARAESDRFFLVAKDLLCVMNREGVLLKVSPSFQSVLGYHEEHFLDKALTEFMDKGDKDQFLAKFSELSGKKTLTGIETKFRSQTESVRILSWAFSLDELTDSIYASARDITLEKELNDRVNQSAKMSSLGEMAAGIAHEINNPLAIIRGKSDYLQKLSLKGNVTASTLVPALEKISATTDRIAKIIKGLKIFSRNAVNDPFEETSLQELFDYTLEFCLERFKSNQVSLIHPTALNFKIDCKPSQISQVLINLLNNSFDAIEHLPERWVRLEVKKLNEDILQIMVTDAGKGIPKEVAEKLMQPFFTTKPVGKGTGLGLSLCRGLIEEHGGRLFLDKEYHNTRFIIELPIHQAQKQTTSVA